MGWLRAGGMDTETVSFLQFRLWSLERPFYFRTLYHSESCNGHVLILGRNIRTFPRILPPSCPTAISGLLFSQHCLRQLRATAAPAGMKRQKNSGSRYNHVRHPGSSNPRRNSIRAHWLPPRSHAEANRRLSNSHMSILLTN